jgi:hypothetical protein
MFERPEEEAAPERDDELDVADLDDDPAYNPDDENLKDLKGG